MDSRRPNRLAMEKSPYLLQHAHNPVDWFPWGDEAFAKARTEDKPIFLSVGYSTCHWCHVMEHECFEDASVAKMLNDCCVAIKVDREERPDIDNVYMTVCQMMTGRGGWPLNIFLTPEGKPFFAGTYFPKDSQPGRIGLLELIPRIHELWRTRRGDLDRSAEQVTEALRALEVPKPSLELADEALFKAEGQLAERYDATHGGFGGAPKFPMPHALLFLLRMWKRTGNAHDLEMVEKTLEAMRLGGMYDHVGHGFHRYSTDREWLLPHFEKMLYDQAQLVMAYTEAFLATGRNFYRRTAEEILEYVLRDLRHPEGAFLSAEDADSEGVEGKFYVWAEKDIRAVLGRQAEPFLRAYNILAGGNFLEEATGHRTGLNIPYLKKPLSELAPELHREFRLSELELSTLLPDQLRLLFHVRGQRPRPHLDDKVLTDWNGLMIAALAMAARAFNDSQWLQAAREAADFLLRRLFVDGRLQHRFRDGQAAIAGNVTDYAFLAWGLVELYQASFDATYLKAALELVETMDSLFWDEAAGGYFFSPADVPLLVRQKDVFDAAIPSGNSVAMLALLKLWRLTGRPELAQRATAVNRYAAGQARDYPAGFTLLLSGVDMAIGPTAEVVVVGRRDAPETRAMLAKLNASYLPNVVVHLREPGDDRLPRLAPFTKPLVPVNGRAVAYVCRDFACSLPVAEVDGMMELLRV